MLAQTCDGAFVESIMGSIDPRQILPCLWCNTLGQCDDDGFRDAGCVGLWDVECIGGVICAECWELDEPHCYNNRDRCAAALTMVFCEQLDVHICHSIVQWVVANTR